MEVLLTGSLIFLLISLIFYTLKNYVITCKKCGGLTYAWDILWNECEICKHKSN